MSPLNESGRAAAGPDGATVRDRNGEMSLTERVRSLRLGQSGQGGGSGRGSVLPWALCAVLFVTAAAFGFRTYRLSPQGEVDGAANPSESVKQGGQSSSNLVTARTADSGEVALEQKGYIIPAHTIQVSPISVSGRLEWLHERFEEGAQFKEGDLLARIEDTEYRAKRDRSRAVMNSTRARLTELRNGSRPEEVKQAEADLNDFDAQARQLKLDWDRVKRLIGTQALTTQDEEKARFAFEAMIARVMNKRKGYELMVLGPRQERIDAAEADFKQAEADLAEAEWRLKNCEIRSPVTGTILAKKAEKGNLVNPSAFSGGLSLSLCDMADLADLEVDLSVQERDISAVFVGQKCTVMPEAFNRYQPFLDKHPSGYEGVVSRLMPIADRAKGAIPVRVKVKMPKEEEGMYLKPDMGVIVVFKKRDAK
jgi:multidrug resistance efflux pump